MRVLTRSSGWKMMVEQVPLRVPAKNDFTTGDYHRYKKQQMLFTALKARKQEENWLSLERASKTNSRTNGNILWRRCWDATFSPSTKRSRNIFFSPNLKQRDGALTFR